MRKRIILLTFIFLLFLTLTGCDAGSKSERNSKSDSDTSELPEVERDLVRDAVNNMTLDEKIGQMVMAGIKGYTIDDNTRRLIEEYHVGGIIILGENVKSTNQLLALLNSLKECNSKNSIPLFISVDEEGGRISRMPDEFEDFPSGKVVGSINNADFSYEIGRAVAAEIKSFGFNMNFAPVLDINSNPNNPVIGDRSFGSEEEIVSRLGIETMKGMQSENIISAVKHFPGHGDTSVDSHKGLPVIYNDIDRLKEFELVPFRKAIENNADVVMIAHILLPLIDPDYPASFSKSIITDILRNQLNFKGIVITDDMTMGAVVENYDIKEAAVKSVNAGADIILVCHGYDREVAVINGLRKAVEDGTIPVKTIDDSVYRILKLKEKYNLSDDIISKVDVEKINDRIKSVLNKYGADIK